MESAKHAPCHHLISDPGAYAIAVRHRPPRDFDQTSPTGRGHLEIDVALSAEGIDVRPSSSAYRIRRRLFDSRL